MARTVATTGNSDIIVAPATAPAAAAIAIVRLSGAGCIGLVQQLFSRDIVTAAPGQMMLGQLGGTGDAAIDKCVAVRWEGPRSYTGEDMVELHLHGSPEIVREAMEACLSSGARTALPGEFTRRAWMNGKMDLAQAEAVASLSSSRTEAARRAALHQLSGGLGTALDEIRHSLVEVTAELEAHIDHPEEGLPAADAARLEEALQNAAHRISSMLESHQRGRRFQTGARIVLAGLPNAGKSSLFNTLLRRERAIVTPHPGTTRDTLEAIVDLAGVPATLVDTAGLRPTAEEIEKLGIERTRQEILVADFVLFLVDPADDAARSAEEYAPIRDLPHAVIVTKSDLHGDQAEAAMARFTGRGRRFALAVSTRSADSIARVESELTAQLLGPGTEESGDPVIIQSRHAHELDGAMTAAIEALHLLCDAKSPEFIVLELQTALSHLDAITGRSGVDEDILDLVFSRFCLGK